MGTIDFKDTLFQRSGRLFATPSFWGGFARALDLGTTFNEYNTDNTPEEADYWSLWSDWHSVGDDLIYAYYVNKQKAPIALVK
jgi:hypothetical protein